MLGQLLPRRSEERSAQLSFPDYLRLWEQFGFNGVQYVIPGGGLAEMTALQAQRNPIVWACISVRVLVFAEIRLCFQNFQAGKPGNLFGTQELAILEQPWAQATTGDLLARMEVDVSMYGNSYWVKAPGGKSLVRLNPTKVIIATTDVLDVTSGKPIGKQLVGYGLTDDRGQTVAFFLPEEVCHYKPIPDPAHEFRGATWLNALLPDVIADSDLTDYKHSFLGNAATPNLVVTFQQGVSEEAFNTFRDKLEARHTGPQAGFKTLYLGAGADVKTVGSNFADLAMASVQSAGETRIAAAAGVPAGIVGIAEGLKGSALNAGNYQAIRRRFSDGTVRPLWRSACGALSTLVTLPAISRLWYDDSDVAFLQEDVTDTAAVRGKNAETILALAQSGFTLDSIVAAVSTGDFTLLVASGLISVQLQPPAPPAPTDQPALPAAPADEVTND